MNFGKLSQLIKLTCHVSILTIIRYTEKIWFVTKSRLVNYGHFNQIPLDELKLCMDFIFLTDDIILLEENFQFRIGSVAFIKL